MSAATHLFGFTAITDQTNHKKKLKSIAKQRFQVFSWFGFERKALYVLSKTYIAT
jgi:hypothetical protein